MKEFSFIDGNFNTIYSKNGVIEFDKQLRDKFSFIASEIYEKYKILFKINYTEKKVDNTSNYKDNHLTIYLYDFIKGYYTIKIEPTILSVNESSSIYWETIDYIFLLMKYCNINWFNSSSNLSERHLENIYIPYVMYSKENNIDLSYKFDFTF